MTIHATTVLVLLALSMPATAADKIFLTCQNRIKRPDDSRPVISLIIDLSAKTVSLTGFPDVLPIYILNDVTIFGWSGNDISKFGYEIDPIAGTLTTTTKRLPGEACRLSEVEGCQRKPETFVLVYDCVPAKPPKF